MNKRKRGQKVTGSYLNAVKFCGLMSAALTFLSTFPDDRIFFTRCYLSLKLSEITGVKKYDKIKTVVISHLIEKGYIAEHFVRTEKKRKLPILQVSDKGKMHLKKFLVKEKKTLI